MESQGATRMIQLSQTVQTWQQLHQTLHEPKNQAEYLELDAFVRELMRQHNTDLEPYQSLWRLAVGYMLRFEQANQMDVLSEFE
jgi:hypothetical protein